MKTRLRVVFLLVVCLVTSITYTVLQPQSRRLDLSRLQKLGIGKRYWQWQDNLQGGVNETNTIGVDGVREAEPRDGVVLGLEETMVDGSNENEMVPASVKASLAEVVANLKEKEEKEQQKWAQMLVELDPSTPDKVVVMGKLHTDDTSWVEKELKDWKHAIYTVDPDNSSISLPSNTLVTPANKGREAMAYLTYIIEHYHSLPSIMAFIHSHRDGYPIAWHTDGPSHSNVYSLQTLKLDYVKKVGYANLRCSPDPGCPAEVQVANPRPTHEPENHYANAWPKIFPDWADTVPPVVAASCCAQFAVSREQVLKRPLEDYERIRDWILETDLNDYISGRIMEYTWHILFGKEAVDCPSARDCYCNVYGRRCRGVVNNVNTPFVGGRGRTPAVPRPVIPPVPRPVRPDSAFKKVTSVVREKSAELIKELTSTEYDTRVEGD